jgi:hypothetical protein
LVELTRGDFGRPFFVNHPGLLLAHLESYDGVFLAFFVSIQPQLEKQKKEVT